MEECDGCQMSGPGILCLFVNDLHCGYITEKILYQCPCKNCLVKITCSFDYCEKYRIYYDMLTKYFKIYRLEYNEPSFITVRNFACMSRLFIFDY